MREKQQRGGIALEAAIAFPLFVMLCLGIIEFTLYFSRKSGLNYAAQRAVDLASKLEVDILTDPTSCEGTLEAAKCLRYLDYVQQILDFCSSTAFAFGADEEQRGRVQFYRADHYYAPPQIIMNRDVRPSVCAFMRPGERTLLTRPDSTTFVVQHPLRPQDDGDSIPEDGEGWPRPGQAWSKILSDFPLVVEIYGEYHPITPFVPGIPMRITQAAFRKSAKTGSGFNPPGSAPTAVPPPPPPVSTATPDPSPTARVTDCSSCGGANPSPDCSSCACNPASCSGG